jgi:CelD/BcsL family acetyltransferase involved in cellulose biosynthesis
VQKYRSDHARIADIWIAIIRLLSDEGIATIQLDNVRADSTTWTCFSQNLIARDRIGSEVKQQDVAPAVVLPTTWEEYLGILSSKDRHELKRKINRLEREHAMDVSDADCACDSFDEFVRLHRLSSSAKQRFMTEPMVEYFRDLFESTQGEWQTKLCSLKLDQRIVAALVYFTDGKKIQLYNSGFDPAYGYYSVGLLAVASLIKHAIEAGMQVFDFLRGNERYKYQLGGKDRELYQIKLTLV